MLAGPVVAQMKFLSNNRLLNHTHENTGRV